MDNMNGDQVAPGQENQEILNNEPVVEPAAEPEAETSAMDTSEPEAKPEAEPETQPVAEPVEEPKNDDPIVIGEKPKKSKTPLIIAIIVLLLLAGGAAAAYFLLNNKPEEQKNNSQANSGNEAKSELRMSGNSLSNFDLSLLKQHNDGENVVYSPLSIKYALKMLSDGANGETKTEIDNVIGDYKAKAYLNSKNRSLANALFIQSSHKNNVLDSYINGLKTNYAAEVIADDFTSAKNINQWISNKTLGIVNNMLKDEDVAELEFALVNALAIDMNWNNRIQCYLAPSGDGFEDNLYTVYYQHEDYRDSISCLSDYNEYAKIEFGDNKTKVDAATIGVTVNKYDVVKTLGEDKVRNTIKTEYAKWLKDPHGGISYNKGAEADGKTIYTADMADSVADKFIKDLNSNLAEESKSSTDFKFYADDEVKVFAKELREYDGSTLEYVAVMPKKQKLEKYIESVDSESLSETISKAHGFEKDNFKDNVVTRVTGKIPFFKYYTAIDLGDDLKNLGIKKAFEDADLSNMMTESTSKFIAVKHKADIEFSNNGIKAAAVTLTGGLGDGGSDEFDYEFKVPVEVVDITFDQPYLYIIRDKQTGEVWFTGAVYEPLEEAQDKLTIE